MTKLEFKAALQGLREATDQLRDAVEQTAASRKALHARGKLCWIDRINAVRKA